MADRTDPPDRDASAAWHDPAARPWSQSGLVAKATASAESERRADVEFSDFYRGYIVNLVRFLMWQGATPADAAEIAQDTMALLYKSWRTVQQREAWARRVATRALVRRIASLNNENPMSQVPDKTATDTGNALLPLRAAAAIEQQAILRVLRLLPPRQRQVMAWSFDGYSPAEIAEELRITPQAVRASLMKARRTLAQLWNDDRGGGQRD